MVICRRLLASTVSRVVMIHRTSGSLHPNSRPSSFVAPERSSGDGAVEEAGITGRGQVSVNHGS